jgi:hypothetical protein
VAEAHASKWGRASPQKRCQRFYERVLRKSQNPETLKHSPNAVALEVGADPLQGSEVEGGARDVVGAQHAVKVGRIGGQACRGDKKGRSYSNRILSEEGVAATRRCDVIQQRRGTSSGMSVMVSELYR